MEENQQMSASKKTRYTIRRLSEIENERSTCGTRQRFFSNGDETPAFLHLVHIHSSKAHYHLRATEFYYVLEGNGEMTVDGETFPISPGTMIKLDPGSVHSSTGDHQVMVIGIPDIADDDIFFPEE